MSNVSEIFGSMVFSPAVMQARLPHDVYKKVMHAIDHDERLTPDIAGVVANAMKDWAIEKGATHFTHWFQPMTGVTAEKHDGFIHATDDGRAIMEFSGKELIQGEPDASSFPSGGLRSTFEARGYTAWDPTSYAFVKDGVLCIPTAFVSYTGEALDKKTPLLRSMQALSKQAVRILRLFGNTEVESVRATAGAEQEYFLVDKSVYDKREDLIYTGRTLFGARPPKGQELDDHYFGAIKPRVSEFMKDLNEELWKLGVVAKTEHNEVAPAQHELAPVFSTVNIAADHNQLTMELMRTVAKRHGMECLLHEKPFAGVNGSGKHNNWSMSTDAGENLLEPGDTPGQNAQFLLFLCAVLKAVNDYQDLLRISVATAGNDHRLGANEAPPAILSVYVGDELAAVLDAIQHEEQYIGGGKEPFKIGVSVLPRFPKDSTDRNRTSSFAFTGNKFEFRMPGSSQSISGANITLNTAVAESLRIFADRLEAADDFDAELRQLIHDVVCENSRIVFNGNGYDDAWVAEAEKRGLLNLRTTPEALPYYIKDKNIKLFETHKVLTGTEVHSRYEIMQENYAKTIKIEAMTMADMVRKDILPAVSAYTGDLAGDAAAKKAVSDAVDISYETMTITRLSELLALATKTVGILDAAIVESGTITGVEELSNYCRDKLFATMNELRIYVDEMETITSEEYWPYPSYGEMLFSVR
ncbi:MAG: glutamine synthetase III [Oscillospiraceae bacterium]|nr:glutamine synthetase III [Oscillospiraceae bacterium]